MERGRISRSKSRERVPRKGGFGDGDVPLASRRVRELGGFVPGLGRGLKAAAPVQASTRADRGRDEESSDEVGGERGGRSGEGDEQGEGDGREGGFLFKNLGMGLTSEEWGAGGVGEGWVEALGEVGKGGFEYRGGIAGVLESEAKGRASYRGGKFREAVSLRTSTSRCLIVVTRPEPVKTQAVM